ncbi:MAG: hypothetical protein A2X18_07640 [Bacteroidetes bacterium GWF2_40_14]|nr:MAG: hypothetical protein A2X18_07640 [Bacteroidetes bacterium GWF2_40_14]
MIDINKIITPERKYADIISDLKKKSVVIPAWSDLEKLYIPKQHRIITDKSLRPKPKIKDGQREIPAKVTYAAEMITTNRMTQMAFSIPVKRIYKTDKDKTKKEQAAAMEAIYKHARIDGVNMNRWKAYFACCEVMTIWYTVEEENKLYGFDSKFKLKCRSYSPMPQKTSKITQASLYPIIDEYEDMIAMSFEYVVDNNGVKSTYFETYTKTAHYKWVTEGTKETDVVIDGEVIKIKKHPLFYAWRPAPIYEDISDDRDEIEFTLSRTSDIIRRNSAPIVKLIGKTIGETPVGDRAREVYQMELGGDVDTVSPSISPESAKYYVSTLKQNMEEYTQLPNLSLENIKSISAISGEARKTLLTDAHLKVGEEKHDIIYALDRECNIIKAFLGEMNTAWKESIKDLSVEHVITPFIQNDEVAEIDKTMKATGGKAVMAQKTAISMLGMVEDPEAEMLLIKAEEDADAERTRKTDVFTNAE